MRKLLLVIAIMLGLSACTVNDKNNSKPADTKQAEEKPSVSNVEGEDENKEEDKKTKNPEKSSEELEKEELKEKSKDAEVKKTEESAKSNPDDVPDETKLP